ncbi:hypothetical protein ACF07B_08480 [Streptomyces sp. NPDC015532]|uniref:hypothetical protein n=1 Tax=Streptomyces sp. NPDC015532 TaxID=3364960 RepID=UPI0036FDBA63
MVSTLADMRRWSRALATGELLKPEVWAEATKDPIPFVFAGNYNGPGKWRCGLGFVESGGFIGGEGSFAGCESTVMYSPSRQTAIQGVSTKSPNPITPPPMFQASPWQSSAPTSASVSHPNKRWHPRSQERRSNTQPKE